MNLIDLLILVMLGLGVYAEASRGLALSLFDFLRILLGLGAGLAAYSVLYRLSRNYSVGLVAFVLVALAVVLLLAWLLKRVGLDPDWGRRTWARAVAGVMGLLLGAAVTLVLIPVLGRSPQLQGDILRAPLARPFVSLVPQMSYLADRTGIELPQLSHRPARFEDEGKSGSVELGERVRFSRLDRAMCIECRSEVEFQGYRLRLGLAVSPRFRCPNCGRTSDGCQTFQGFHAMYRHCPTEVARGMTAIDCGVWPNNRPVQPKGVCPTCGRLGTGR